MFMKLQKGQKGFTLIELMIVVAIIGILAAIAIPNFLRYQCKSKQSEAKGNLGAIFTSNVAYFSEEDTYGGIGLLGWAPAGTTRYGYTVAVPDSSHFTATASTDPAVGTVNANGQSNIDNDAAHDEWTINEVRALNNTINDCS